MGLNFLVDFFLILGTNRLTGFSAGIKRAILAATVGAVYSGACLMPGMRFLGSNIWRLISLGLMGSVAFGWDRSMLRRTVMLILLSMALGGIALGFGRGSMYTLILSAAGMWLLCRIGFAGVAGQEYISVTISHENKQIRLLALRDTGNTLRDTITGEEVLVIGAGPARELTGLTSVQLSHPVETAAKVPGFRLIPYHAVGNPGGMLLMKRFADVKLNGKRRNILVAFAPEEIGREDGYQALAGGMMG